MKRIVWLVAMCAAVTLMAAAPAFEKVPGQAMTMLKGEVGKPLNSGLVFANGHYIHPPYRVARMGTAIYINDVQVTGQIHSWRKFLATQPGYTGRIVPKGADDGKVAKNLEDLFADEDPGSKETAEVEAPFSPNAKSDALLKDIKAYRTEVQRLLREGNILFFGSRYARVAIEPRVAKSLLGVLPEAMRDADDGVDLEARLRTHGIVFLNRTLCSELLENRPDYLKIGERRKFLQELERLDASATARQNAVERGR